MSALPSTSSSSSASSFNIFTYDVFLNFSAADTRDGFTGNLYKALCDKGFYTFFDDEELFKGEEITPALVEAIQESRIAITVFSKNYATSSFCLDELVKIMECFKEQGRSVLPVFYDVDPCDVQHQRGTYGEALLSQGRFKDAKEKVQKWREALRQAANLSGNDFKLGNEFECEFIDKIIKEVSKIISPVPLKIEEHPIGLESRVSFDALEEVHQKIFLDIACCFNGYKLKAVEEMLHAHYGESVKDYINILVEKSLIKIEKHNSDDYVTLHDLIQDMGREIVRLESPNEPGARSRLWLAEEIIEVLQGDKGSSKVQVINLEFDDNGDVIDWDGLAFKKMENLRTLIIEGRQFSQFPKYLPSSLRVLKWRIHPSQEILPFDFHPKQLVILDLSGSCFDSVQIAELMKKKFENTRVLNFDYCARITKIPNLSSAPKLEVLSFVCCYELTEIDESVGSLDKLETLDAFGCSKLRSLPPLMLPSLKDLNLKYCSSLESFPEILGKMECLTHLSFSSNHIKKLPYSIHNLTGLQSLYLSSREVVELPRSITLLNVKNLMFSHFKGLQLPNQDEAEEQVSSMAVSHATHLHIFDCNISEEFFRIALPLFPRLQSLSLTRENFRILPECIGEFQFLRSLKLRDCKKLEEIRGIPPNIEKLHASNCRSLSSLTREMLLNKKLYEKGQDKTFILPGNRLPVWFEYQRRESSINFWFRNKSPAISFGVLNPSTAFSCFIRARVTINGTESFQLVEYDPYIEEKGQDGLIFIFSMPQTTFRDQVDEALSENEWNHVVFSVYYYEGEGRQKQKDLSTVEVGVHIIKESSSMDDIRFTDALPLTFNDNVNGNSNSKWMSSTTTTLSVQGLQEEQNLTSIDQHKLECCGSVDKACDNNNAREDKGKNPSAELLSTTKEETEIYQPASNDKTVAWDPMELECQLTIGSNNKSTGSNEAGLEEPLLAKRQFCLCSLFSSLVSLCTSSSSSDSP